jgi:hypothetical protein
MVDSTHKRRPDRACEALYVKSLKRLKKRGASDDDADQIAGEVAEKSAARMKAPVFHTDEEFADLVSKVCTKLGAGMSYYELFGDIPFLASGRIDRVVAVALRTKPPIDMKLARSAKRATGLGGLPGGVAILLFALALGTIGLWYAIAVGAVVCVATEIYVQAWMPASLRRSVAVLRVPAVVSVAAAIALAYLAYRWYEGVEAHPYLLASVAAVAVVAIAFLVPGITLAQLVSRRERKWRRDLERILLKEKGYGADRGRR